MNELEENSRYNRLFFLILLYVPIYIIGGLAPLIIMGLNIFFNEKYKGDSKVLFFCVGVVIYILALLTSLLIVDTRFYFKLF